VKVCFITSLYPPIARGGAEQVVHREARMLKKAGHDVVVITAEDVRKDGSIEPRMSVEGGVRVWRYYPLNFFFYGEIGKHSFLSRVLWHLWDLWGYPSSNVVKKLLEKERPDVVHTQNLKGIGFGVPSVVRRLGLRHVHTLHDVQLAVPSGLLMKGEEDAAEGAFNRLYARIMRRRFGSPGAVLSPSKFLLEFYSRRGFFPSSDFVFLANPAPSAVRHERVPSPSGETRFLYLGQLEPHKGVIPLIETMKRLFEKHPKARLTIVGDGSEKKAALKAAGGERRIAFHGKVRPEQLPSVFAKTDYAVLNSLCYENAPTVVGESFAHGVPIVVSRIGGAAELVRDGENGLVFEAGDADALFAALVRACAEKESLWEARSKAALGTAKLLDEHRHLKRLEAIYLKRDPALSHAGPVVPMRYKYS
jgi:glycosyltransferase involved in cell wall biosynthesis